MAAQAALPDAKTRGAQLAEAMLGCMSDEVQLSVALPLDSDGFLRRECPTCEREFKWLPLPDTEGDEAVIAGNEEGKAPESYYCPQGLPSASTSRLTAILTAALTAAAGLLPVRSVRCRRRLLVSAEVRRSPADVPWRERRRTL